MNLASQKFWLKISDSLSRNLVTRPSKWAEKYRIINERPWIWRKHPWLKEMHDSTSRENIGQKAAQMGFTELVMNLAFYCIDIKKKSVLYVLPSKFPDAADFSTTRFDPALEASPHLQQLFTSNSNMSVKRAGAATLYVRGAQSRAGLKSLPVSTLILDELDEMNRESVALAKERVSGQDDFLTWMISTPSIEEHGINLEFSRSTQDHFFFPCPGCSRQIELTLENLVIVGDDPKLPEIQKSHLICTQCKKVLHHKQKPEFLENAKYVSKHPDFLLRGFYINQLYSSAAACEPWRIAQYVLEAEHDPATAQELYNSKMGMTYRDKGTNISLEEVQQALRHYETQVADGTTITTMGIDVGSGQNHYWWIDEWYLPTKRTSIDINDDAQCRTLNCGTVDTFEELAQIFALNNITFGVIDVNPETSSAKKLAEQFYGRMKLCYFIDSVNGKSIDPTRTRDDDMFINVNRTVWYDTRLGRFKQPGKRIVLPRNINKNALVHLTKPTKIYKKDKNGNKRAMYLTPDKVPDHYASASIYSEIALKLAVESSAIASDIPVRN